MAEPEWIFLESGVERMTLSAYQDWRAKQPDHEQEDGRG